MQAEEESLRVNFCSLLLQAKGSIVANFVAWLDLKVAEYKVYGHMILSESSENDSSAWPMASPVDPESWPMEKPDGQISARSSFAGNKHSSQSGDSASGMEQTITYALHSINRRGHPVIGKGGRGAVRGRIARPQSVTAKLLKNAISRSTKNVSQIISSADTASSSHLTSSMLSSPQTITSSSASASSLPHTVTREHSSSSQISSHPNATEIKMEPGAVVTLDSDSETETADIKPEISHGEELLDQSDSDNMDFKQEEDNSWNQAGPSSMLVSSGGPSVMSPAGAVASVMRQMMPSLVHGGGSTPQRQPIRKQPVSQPRGPRPSTTAASPATPSSLRNLTTGRTPRLDSVNELLEAHTIQTESGSTGSWLSSVCELCGTGFASPLKMANHKKACRGFIHCRFCGLSFNRSYSRNRHEKYCNKQPGYIRNVYQCRNCTKVFNRPDNAKAHERKCRDTQTC